MNIENELKRFGYERWDLCEKEAILNLIDKIKTEASDEGFEVGYDEGVKDKDTDTSELYDEGYVKGYAEGYAEGYAACQIEKEDSE